MEAVKVVQNVKETALASQDSSHQLLAQVSVGISAAGAAKLPQANSWKRSVCRVRNNGQVALPMLQPLSELQISTCNCSFESCILVLKCFYIFHAYLANIQE